MNKEDLSSIEIEKLKQIISRTDKSGNEKVLLLMDFIYTREKAICPELETELEHAANLLYNLTFDDPNICDLAKKEVSEFISKYRK